MKPKKGTNDNIPRFVARDANLAGKEYLGFVKSLIERYKQSQIKAAVKINTAMLEYYWALGRDIVRLHADAKWGSAFFDSLSLDLKAAFPGETGFSSRNIRYAYKWYLFYTQSNEILHQVGAEFQNPAIENLQQPIADLEMPIDFGMVPWRHHIEIFTHVKSVTEALFYIDETIKAGWSRSQLEVAIEHNLYAAKKGVVTNFDEQLPATQSGLAKSILKSPYKLGFLPVGSDRTEKILEDELAKNITHFLLELGQGFAYVGRQMELVMPGGQTFIPDMIFYNYKIRSFLVLELKVTDYKPEYVGKLNFYVSAVDELMKQEDDNPTIGLLICKSKDDTVVEWSFRGLNRPLGVAAYELNDKLSELLPSEEQIQNLINGINNEND